MPSPRTCSLALLGWLALLPSSAAAAGAEIPPWLPRYDLNIRLDVAGHRAHVLERVTWTNRHQRPATELIFNVYSRYKIPDGQVGLLAKTVELLRLSPSEALDFEGRACEVQRITLGDQTLDFHYQPDNQTALVVPLPGPVGSGETITIEFMVFDVSDGILDSLALLDAFEWSVTPSGVGTVED